MSSHEVNSMVIIYFCIGGNMLNIIIYWGKII